MALNFYLRSFGLRILRTHVKTTCVYLERHAFGLRKISEIPEFLLAFGLRKISHIYEFLLCVLYLENFT